jgi:uncharacterized protein YxeA
MEAEEPTPNKFVAFCSKYKILIAIIVVIVIILVIYFVQKKSSTSGFSIFGSKETELEKLTRETNEGLIKQINALVTP